MPASHLERLLDKAIAENAEAMFRVKLGDSLQHARIVGVREGLTTARSLIREAARADLDAEDGL